MAYITMNNGRHSGNRRRALPALLAAAFLFSALLPGCRPDGEEVGIEDAAFLFNQMGKTTGNTGAIFPVSGTLSNINGPIKNAMLFFNSQSSSTAAMTATRMSRETLAFSSPPTAITNSSGKFQVDLSPGRYRVYIYSYSFNLVVTASGQSYATGLGSYHVANNLQFVSDNPPPADSQMAFQNTGCIEQGSDLTVSWSSSVSAKIKGNFYYSYTLNTTGSFPEKLLYEGTPPFTYSASNMEPICASNTICGYHLELNAVPTDSTSFDLAVKSVQVVPALSFRLSQTSSVTPILWNKGSAGATDGTSVTVPSGSWMSWLELSTGTYSIMTSNFTYASSPGQYKVSAISGTIATLSAESGHFLGSSAVRKDGGIRCASIPSGYIYGSTLMVAPGDVIVLRGAAYTSSNNNYYFALAHVKTVDASTGVVLDILTSNYNTCSSCGQNMNFLTGL